MRSLGRGFTLRDLKLEPVSLLEMMNTPVERQEKLESVFWRPPFHIMW